MYKQNQKLKKKNLFLKNQVIKKKIKINLNQKIKEELFNLIFKEEIIQMQ